MKKKLLAMVITISMMCGLCACGASDAQKAASVTIEENTYDLSGDFQEVVGSMAENDLQVISILSTGLDFYTYDEDGKIYKNEDFDKEEPYIYAMEKCVIPEMDDAPGAFIQKVYYFDANVEFESKLGFDSDSEEEDVEDLDGFMKCTPIRMMKNDAYVALFVDGKMVDFGEYEDDFDEWKEMLDEEGYAKAHEEFFPGASYVKTVCRMFSADFARMCNTYDELKERLDGTGILLEEEILLAFAMQEACELLEEDEAQKVVVVRVEVSGDNDAIMEYDEFYFDEDWDNDKFKK